MNYEDIVKNYGPFFLKVYLDWLNFEMQTSQRENQALEILDQVVERAKTIDILTILNFNQWSDLAKIRI